MINSVVMINDNARNGPRFVEVEKKTTTATTILIFKFNSVR